MSAKSFGDLAEQLLADLAAGKSFPITKRATLEMAFEHYIPNGWKIYRREGRNVVLVWPKAGAPE